MPTKEALKIYDQAVELLYNDVKDKQAVRDSAAMLLVALEQAGGPFPDAEAELAVAYYLLGDEYEGKMYADRALRADPNSFLAQYVKTHHALVSYANAGSVSGLFAGQKLKSELDKLIVIFENRCRIDESAGLFIRRCDLLQHFRDERMPYVAKKRVPAAIAGAPIDHLKYESDEQRAEVQKLRTIAQGRLKM